VRLMADAANQLIEVVHTYPKTRSRPRELVNTPKALIADLLARRIERNAVEFAERVNFVPMRANVMAEVTYFVALPFVASDDGVAAGEPTECFNPNAAVMRAEALSRKEGNVAPSRSAARVILPRAISAMPR
jgi:hypothetical protein